MIKIIAGIPCGEKQKRQLTDAVNGRGELVFVSPAQLSGAVLADADVVIGNPRTEALKAAGRLRWLQITSAGAEYYAQDPDFPKEVILTNVTGAFGEVIAEYIIAGILALDRNLFAYKDQQRARRWQDAGGDCVIYGKQALILGAGDIGTQTAKRLHAFGASVTGIRRNKREPSGAWDGPGRAGAHVRADKTAGWPDFDRIAGPEELDTLLPEADLVIGCLPHTPETVHMLDERRLRLIKTGAILVNVGRGSLIETDALVRVLQEGRLSGAVLDVFEEEPLPKEHPLWGMEQVLLTPHVSGRSFGHARLAEERIYAICCENLRRFFDGRELRNRVSLNRGYADYHDRGAVKE